MPNVSATALSCLVTVASAALGHCTSFVPAQGILRRAWRTFSLRSPDVSATHKSALSPLLCKELREILGGRALWTMLLFLCPLVGYGFFQAASLYGEASASARDSPVLASGLSPLDGVLVPSFGA